MISPLHITVKLGHCVPDSCSNPDVRNGFQNFLNNVTGTTNALQAFIYDCHTADESIPIDASDWVVGSIILILVLIILVGTAIDLGLNVLQLSLVSDQTAAVFQGFSLYENIGKLFRVGPNRDGLGSIHGIRFISMTWVLLGHTYLKYITNNAFYNNYTDIIPLYAGSTTMSAVRSAPFSVDTFFLIGATLLAYLTMKELDKSQGGGAQFWVMYYVHRYLRLTGVYAVVVALHATYLKFLATGPNSYTLDDTRHSCRDGWWLNLLYINNFNEDLGREHCIGWSWYLANDMQMFLISPLVIYPLWRRPLAGALWSGLLLVLATVLRLVRELQDYGDPVREAANFYEVYSKPWYRYQPYIIGLMLGAGLFHLRKWRAFQATIKTSDGDAEDTTNHPKAVSGRSTVFIAAVAGGWALAWLAGLWCVYGRAWAGREFTMPKAGYVTFESFSKVGWSLALAWVIFACAEVSERKIKYLFANSFGYLPSWNHQFPQDLKLSNLGHG